MRKSLDAQPAPVPKPQNLTVFILFSCLTFQHEKEAEQHRRLLAAEEYHGDGRSCLYFPFTFIFSRLLVSTFHDFLAVCEVWLGGWGVGWGGRINGRGVLFTFRITGHQEIFTKKTGLTNWGEFLWSFLDCFRGL